MAANEVHKDDVGTVFIFTITDGTAVDVSGATTKQILFTKPDGTVDTQTAAFTTDGTNGQIQYTTLAADIDQAGNWSKQAKLIIASGTFYTDVHYFTVHDNLA